MSDVALFDWLRGRPKELPPSPIPEAAKETRRIADEVSKVADQLKRLNDAREARPQ